MTGIKENGIKHCYIADKGNTLLEPSLKVLFIKFGWGATFKSQRMDIRMPKMQMAAFFGKSLLSQLQKSKDGHKNAENANGCLLWQKLIISASTLFRKPCLGSKLGYLRSRNPFM